MTIKNESKIFDGLKLGWLKFRRKEKMSKER